MKNKGNSLRLVLSAQRVSSATSSSTIERKKQMMCRSLLIEYYMGIAVHASRSGETAGQSTRNLLEGSNFASGIAGGAKSASLARLPGRPSTRAGLALGLGDLISIGS